MKKEIRSALWTAGALIGAALLLKWLSSTGVIGGDTSQRLIQVAIGLVLVLSANAVPKQLAKLDGGCEPSRRQSRQRRAGWAFVIAGFVYAIAWLVAPMDTAFVISVSVLGAAMLLVLASCLWPLVRRSKAQIRH